VLPSGFPNAPRWVLAAAMKESAADPALRQAEEEDIPA